MTPWQGLFDHARLKAGERVLLHGAAGAVGALAVRLAHGRGARLIDTHELRPPTVAAVFWLAQAREAYAPAQQGHLDGKDRAACAGRTGVS